MLIITGTGRSGTAAMAKVFGGNHEYRAAYLLEKYFSGPDPHVDPFATIEQRITAVLDLHQGIDENSFVDSSNLYIHLIDAITILNPSARFVLAVRDGRDFVRSAYSRKWHERLSFGMVPPYGDPLLPKWAELTPLQKNAWIWNYRNLTALNSLKAVPGKQKLIMKIEDLGTSDCLDRLEAFSGIPLRDREVAGKKINANPFFDLPPKEQWSGSMVREFKEIAGELMDFFGYSF